MYASPGRAWRAAVLVGTVGMLAACPARPLPDPEAFTVRLLTSAPLSGRWERAAEQGLGMLAAELGAQVERVRCAPTGLGTAVQPGDGDLPDLVFCVGPGFENAVFAEASTHPELRFVLLPGGVTAANVAGIDFVADGAAFLGGVVAGTLSERPVAGVIRGPGRPWLVSAEQGFEAGFASVWKSPELHSASGADAPWELLRAGVQVALYAADAADPAVLSAAHNAGLLLLSVEPELMNTDPDTVVAAIAVDVPEAMLRVAREARDGSFRGMVYIFDLGSGVVDLELNPDLEATRRRDVIERLEQARTEVTAGIVEIEKLGI